MKHFVFLITLCSAITAFGETPAELDRLETAYQQELEKVNAPLRSKYREALVRLRNKFGENGQIEKAVLVDRKISDLDEDSLVKKLLRTPKYAWNLSGNLDIPEEQLKSTLTFYADGRLFEEMPNHKNWSTWKIDGGKLVVYGTAYTFDGLKTWIGKDAKGKPLSLVTLPPSIN